MSSYVGSSMTDNQWIVDSFAWISMKCDDGIHVKIRNNATWQLIALDSDGKGYLQTFTNFNDDIETSSAHWLLTEYNCDTQMINDPEPAPSEITFNYDSSSVEFNITAALTSFSTWENYFQSPGCYDFQSCWLSTQDGSANVTHPIYMGSNVWQSSNGCNGNAVGY